MTKKNKYWTEVEVDYLVSAVRSKTPCRELAHKLRRSEKSVYAKINNLKREGKIK